MVDQETMQKIDVLSRLLQCGPATDLKSVIESKLKELVKQL